MKFKKKTEKKDSIVLKLEKKGQNYGAKRLKNNQ